MTEDQGNVNAVVSHLKEEIADKSLKIAILQARVDALAEQLHKQAESQPKLPLEDNDE